MSSVSLCQLELHPQAVRDCVSAWCQTAKGEPARGARPQQRPWIAALTRQPHVWTAVDAYSQTAFLQTRRETRRCRSVGQRARSCAPSGKQVPTAWRSPTCTWCVVRASVVAHRPIQHGPNMVARTCRTWHPAGGRPRCRTHRRGRPGGPTAGAAWGSSRRAAVRRRWCQVLVRR